MLRFVTLLTMVMPNTVLVIPIFLEFSAIGKVLPMFSIGELWSVAIHLRMALVENLQRLSTQAIHAREARNQADELANRLLGLDGQPEETLEEILRPFDVLQLDV